MKFFTLHFQQHEEKQFQTELRKLDMFTTVWRGPAGDLAIGHEDLDEDNFGDYSQAGLVLDYVKDLPHRKKKI